MMNVQDGKWKLEKTNLALISFLYSLIKDDLHITISAQVFTIPVIFFTFGRISLVSPLTNILIGWIIAPFTVIGMAVAISEWIFCPSGMFWVG